MIWEQKKDIYIKLQYNNDIIERSFGPQTSVDTKVFLYKITLGAKLNYCNEIWISNQKES